MIVYNTLADEIWHGGCGYVQWHSHLLLPTLEPAYLLPRCTRDLAGH